MLAQQDIMIESASGRVVLRAEKELILNVGGSYIKITPSLIENGTSGQILEKCASWDKPGASTMTLRDPLNGTPVSKHGGYADDFSG
ncbi:hypothetical protein SY91_03407 [Burkholderia cenocepacia]|nr:hypothetical protein SY91_03407 [Burkholderia cenocepacia]